MMKNDSLKQLAQGLAEKGIASLRIDKRGIGESRDAAKSEEELRFETYAKDLTAWLNLLDEDSRFSSTTLLGHSEGSLVGGVALVKFNAPADGIISLAGAGFPAGVVLRQQMAERLPETLNQESNHILDSLEQGELVEDPNPALYVLYRPSVQPYMISWLQYDPAQIYAEIKQPVLIIQGSSDIQVSENDANRLAEAGPHTLQVIDGMNHVLKQVDGDLQSQLPSYSDPEIPLHPELVGVVVGFVEGL